MYAYDTDNPRAMQQTVPLADIDAVFAYDDTFADSWASEAPVLFPGKIVRTITRTAGTADIADCEPGCMTVEETIVWARDRPGSCVYSDRSQLPALAVPLSGTPVFWLLAIPGWPDALPGIPGCIGVQNVWARTYDRSYVAPGWLQVQVPPKGPDMPPSGATASAPCVTAKLTASGNGYYMVGADGAVYTYGDAIFHGSLFGVKLSGPIVGIDVRPDNTGYILFGADYGVYTFGSCTYHGHPTW
jgi:hypothetical protein